MWGVAYLCNSEAVKAMDEAEGVARGHYKHAPVRVHADDGDVLEAIAYVAADDHLCADGEPSDDYLNRIILGAEHHLLPAHYVEHIREVARSPQATER